MKVIKALPLLSEDIECYCLVGLLLEVLFPSWNDKLHHRLSRVVVEGVARGDKRCVPPPRDRASVAMPACLLHPLMSLSRAGTSCPLEKRAWGQTIAKAEGSVPMRKVS